MKRPLLSLLVLAVLTPVAGFTQEIPIPMPITNQQKLVASAIMEPALNSFFSQYRPGMLGISFAMNPMFKAGFEKEFGFTEEQSAQIMGKFQEKFEGAEAMEAFGQVMGQIVERAGQNEDAGSFGLSEEEAFALQRGFDNVFEKFSEIAFEIFTPEQMVKIGEMEFATFGGIESPFVSVDAMSVLDLTDEQVREIEEFQQDLADEKLEMGDDLTAFTKKVITTGKLNLQEAEAFNAKYKALTDRIGMRIREILTEEQLEKATKIVKDQQARMAKMMGGLGAISQWMPGPDSWMPGMPIPDSLKPQETPRRFPQARPRNTPAENEN